MARVLVVDDDPSVRELMTLLAHLDGHSPRWAEDGYIALEMCERELPDLILLDIAMPGMDGWHFLDELHQRDMRQHTRVVLVSAHLESGDHDARVRHVLAKPFSPDLLLQVMRDALAEPADEIFARKAQRDLVGVLRVLRAVGT